MLLMHEHHLGHDVWVRARTHRERQREREKERERETFEALMLWIIQIFLCTCNFRVIS